jgi:L-serine/L-threonine ammonia-lyase
MRRQQSVCFADDERILVEAACSVSNTPAYNDKLHSLLFLELGEIEFSNRHIVIVVCGGSNVTLQILEQYKKEYVTNMTVGENFHARKLDAQRRKNPADLLQTQYELHLVKNKGAIQEGSGADNEP